MHGTIRDALSELIRAACVLEAGDTAESMNNTRIFSMPFASVYPHYVAKAEKRGRTKADVHTIIHWLTGYDEQALQQQIEKKVDFETFFAEAPRITPNASKITGVICGYRVERSRTRS